MSKASLARWQWLMGSRHLYQTYQQSLQLCQSGDALLLMGQHIYLLVDDRLYQPPLNVDLFVLVDDLKMAGLTAVVPSYVQVIDWQQVINLLAHRYCLQQTWV